jgi:hypothetical protein
MKVKSWWSLGLLPPLFVAAACTTVVRENIISSIQTGVGITVAENPQTQLYEAKAGYIRSQFYSIPTGKNVESKDNKEKLSNDAQATPQVVSGIRLSTGARHLFLGIDVSESFAVGETAVNSKAAIAMYISEAKDPVTALAASKATTAITQSLVDKQRELDEIVKKPLKDDITEDGQTYKKNDANETMKYAEHLVNKISGGKKTYKEVRRFGGEDLSELVEALREKVQ